MRRIRTVTAARSAAVVAVMGTALAVAIPASSAHSRASAAAATPTVDFYSSLPLSGSTVAQTGPAVNGMKLALQQAGYKAGHYKIKYTSLNDATAAAGAWTPEATSANARKVAGDPNAVYYMGEFNSGASEVSMPILNQAGIAQDSPANTYVGLTTSLKGVTAPGGHRSTSRPGRRPTRASSRSTRCRAPRTCRPSSRRAARSWRYSTNAGVRRRSRVGAGEDRLDVRHRGRQRPEQDATVKVQLRLGRTGVHVEEARGAVELSATTASVGDTAS